MTIRIDATHNPDLLSWVDSANGHPAFPIQNLPLGIFSAQGGSPRPGVAIGDRIVDLAAIASWLPAPAAETLDQPTLNALFALPSAARTALRQRLSQLLSLPASRPDIEPHLHMAADCTMHLPAAIGDYTDFYVGIHHASNIGALFRPDNPLLPNYKWVPIGYHGRASSIRPSGDPVIRPHGQIKPADADQPRLSPSNRLDYELELGVWIGAGNMLGTSIPVEQAADHIAGITLLNDWSARDFQAWEYQPLGPFLAKNFHSSVSPWVVTMDALAPFRLAQPDRPQGDPPPLDYLLDTDDQAHGALSVTLDMFLTSQTMRDAGLPPFRLSQGSATHMYWTIAQMVAHHSVNGCNLNPGDLLGTGTISGPSPDSFGSLMEISRGGAQPVTLPTGETRTFLADGDEVTMAGTAHADGFVSIGFGECRAVILPARA